MDSKIPGLSKVRFLQIMPVELDNTLMSMLSSVCHISRLIDMIVESLETFCCWDFGGNRSVPQYPAKSKCSGIRSIFKMFLNFPER